MGKRIFLTGSTGFIGEQLSRKLLSLGHQLHLLVRNPERSSFAKNGNVTLFKGDLSDEEVLLNGISGCDEVYHLAGCAKSWAPSSDEYYETNVNGTIKVLTASKINKVKKVVVTSTCAVLGPSYLTPVNEETQRQEPFFNHYDQSKHLMEKLVKKFAKNGLPTVIVNPPRVYGPGVLGESNTLIELIKKYLAKDWRFIPDRDRIGSYAFIDDVVEGHILAMEKGKSGERYILGGDNKKLMDIFNVVRQLSWVKHPLYKVPVRLILAASLLETSICRLLGKKPKLPYDWSNKLTYNWAVSSKKAITELGYKVTPIEKGLEETLKWLNQTENSGKVLITGASSGIGRSLATEFALMNLDLILVSLPNTGLPQVADELNAKYGVNANYYETDLTLKEAPRELYQWVKQNGFSVRILVNNAGIGHQGLFLQIEDELAQKIIDLNIISVVKLSRIFLPDLLKHKGSQIINVASLAGLFPIPNKAVYSASKSFIVSFSTSLRHELRPFGIQVSCLCPGGTLTSPEIVRRIKSKRKFTQRFAMKPEVLAKKCIGRLIKGREIVIPAWYNRAFVFVSQLMPKKIVPIITGRIFNN